MTQIYAERALAIYLVYTMSARSGVIKAIANFYRDDSDTAFELQRSCIPINYGHYGWARDSSVSKEASVFISWPERTGNEIQGQVPPNSCGEHLRSYEKPG